MRLVPVFTLETNNHTYNECLPKFVKTHNASSSIKTANMSRKWNSRSEQNLNLPQEWYSPSYGGDKGQAANKIKLLQI